jgi:hypothetical protein
MFPLTCFDAFGVTKNDSVTEADDEAFELELIDRDFAFKSA